MELVRNGISIAADDNILIEMMLHRLRLREIGDQPPELTPFFGGQSLPMIGEVWAGQGGIYAGIHRAWDGPSVTFQHLILGPELEQESWNAIDARNRQLVVDGHKDFRFPTRPEGRLLFAQLKDHFKAECYWLEQHAGDASVAYAQYFAGGGQLTWTKGNNAFRARPVRSFPALAI